MTVLLVSKRVPSTMPRPSVICLTLILTKLFVKSTTSLSTVGSGVGAFKKKIHFFLFNNILNILFFLSKITLTGSGGGSFKFMPGNTNLDPLILLIWANLVGVVSCMAAILLRVSPSTITRWNDYFSCQTTKCSLDFHAHKTAIWLRFYRA